MLTPIEVGSNIIRGLVGTEIKPGVICLSDPVYKGNLEYQCLANVFGSLCIIAVHAKIKESRSDQKESS